MNQKSFAISSRRASATESQVGMDLMTTRLEFKPFKSNTNQLSLNTSTF